MNLFTDGTYQMGSNNLLRAIEKSHKMFLNELSLVGLSGDISTALANITFCYEEESVCGVLDCRNFSGELFEKEILKVIDYVASHKECKSVIISFLNLVEQNVELSAITVCFNGELGNNLVKISNVWFENQDLVVGDSEGPFTTNMAQSLSLQLLEFWLSKHK